MQQSATTRTSETATITIKLERLCILSGMTMQRPEMTLSDLIDEALVPFCRKNRRAGGNRTIYVQARGGRI
jgi:hypothetical protein